MRDKIFVISVDALVREDIAYLKTKPNFSKLMADSAEVEHVLGIYPSITYPAHVSIVTGCYPGKHGVVTNTMLKTVDDGKDDWILYADNIRTEDLFAAAKRRGCSTASVFWPVMGKNPNIDYLINEYFLPNPEETVLEAYRKFGADEDTLAIIHENEDRLPVRGEEADEHFNKRNTFDDFINGCACSLIRRYQPDLLMIHNCMVDSIRHRFGVLGPETKRGLDLIDDWLGELVETMKDAGVYECTNFVILSDHGQMDYVRQVRPNALLQRGGFIDLDEKSEVVAWRAFALSNGKSATVFLKNKADGTLREEVQNYLKSFAKDEKSGIQAVFTEEETRERYNLYGGFAFLLEAEDNVAFSDYWKEPWEVSQCVKGAHGYQPEKGPQPVFIARGPAFCPGTILPAGRLVDEAPTLARVLGTEMSDADGVCLEALLRR